jgi:phosphate transport system substrate-binding protein
MRNKLLAAAAIAAGIGYNPIAQARDYISIVGSSTVYPFATAVAEQFGRAGSFKTPKIESTGTGGGFKLFCGGIGVAHPDIANASRRIKDSEVNTCEQNGVKDLVEVKIGYDGIAIANSKTAPAYKLTLKDIYLALAKDILDPKGGDKLIPNPNTTWKQVNNQLPDKKIEVLGPPPTSGTRDAFAELAMEGGCKTYPWIMALKDKDEARFKATCHTMREDGAYVEAGENDNLILQKLQTNTNALGIFGFSFLDQNADKVQAATVEGKGPKFESIADGTYVISRPLFFYVKKAHLEVIPGIKEYVAEFTSDKAMGEEGYLADKGLIPLKSAERARVVADAKSLKNFSLQGQ